MSEPAIPRTAGGNGRLGLTIGVGVIVVLGYGIYTHIERGIGIRALAAEREAQVPDVRTITVHNATTPVTLDLPGETVGLETSAIGARAAGYIEKRLVDIGTPVKAGQVLAVIRAPELDHRVAQAQAALAQARANMDLAGITARRTGGLVGGGAVSKQNYDVDRLTQQSRQAEQKAADAVLAETAQRQAYTTVTAPFDGVVTARNVEVGDLVSADNAQDRPLFVVTRSDRLRVRVHVPQDEAMSVHVGDPATVSVPERPAQRFTGTVTRTGDALEQTSRMLPVEIELDNQKGELASGLYATVHFALPRPTSSTVIIPAEALCYEADGLSVETVGADNTVTIRKVKVGRDDGDVVEILDGLPDGSRLIVHPPSSLRNGDRVVAISDADGKGA